MARSEFVGVDGCRRGWFSIGLDHCSEDYEMHVFCRFSKLLEHYQDASLVRVDIPIGLPESRGGRDADRCARKLLGHPRGSSVFPTPTRQTVERAAQAPQDYTAAAAKERKTAGKGLSRQTFAIAPKIAEVDKCWQPAKMRHSGTREIMGRMEVS